MEVVPVDVGMEAAVEDDVWEPARPVPEDEPWDVAPAETPEPAVVAWAEPANAEPWVVAEAAAPELVAVLGLAAC